jgi:phosphotriesterase-related protein
MGKLITTLGAMDAVELGMILPHEHIFVDLRTGDQPGFAQADPADVITLMEPELELARAAGVTALVECSTVGVGRRVDILKAVSHASGFPIVVPTGIYREPWVPRWAHDAGLEELMEWMISELLGDVEGSGVPAGWIKLSAGDDGLTTSEGKILRAAARASARTGAAIGSHTVRGAVVKEQLDILAENGCAADRFIWIHASAEADADINLEVARRGAYVEYDWIGGEQPDELFIERICKLAEAGLLDRVLLSHDRGWYDPAQPRGGIPKPMTYISERFIPALRVAGFTDAEIRLMTQENPFRAFAR